MLRRLGEGIEGMADATKGVMAAAKRGVGDFDPSHGSFSHLLGNAPEPTRVEAFQRLPKPAAETEQAEEELRSVIAEGYFEKDFDPVRHLLESLPPDSDEPGASARFAKHMSEEIVRYDSALDRVTHELSANVMANYGTFVNGMSQISELGSDLIVTGMRCKAARRHLRAADSALPRTGLSIIGKLRRRAAMRAIAARLEGITGAVQAANRLQALLAAELSDKATDAPPLPQLLDGCRLLATCVTARETAGDGSLLQRLSVIAELETVQARLLALLDDARRRLCAAFEPDAYRCVLQCALALRCIDDLVASTPDAFAAAISRALHEAARRCVFEQLGLSPAAPSQPGLAPAPIAASGARTPPERGATMPATSADAAAIASSLKQTAAATQRQRVHAASLKELVAMVHEDRVGGTLNALLRALCEALSAHHAMVILHADTLSHADGVHGGRRAPGEAADGGGGGAAGGAKARGTALASAEPAPAAGMEVPRAAHETLARGLALSRGAVWVEMQRQLAVLLVLLPTATFSVEQMLRLVKQVDSFMRLGHAFSGEPATVLRASVRTKSAAFYAAFHRERVDELRMRLESELWQRLPLRHDALRSAMFAAPSPDAARAPPPPPSHSASVEGVGSDIVLPAGGATLLFPASYSPLHPLFDADLESAPSGTARGGCTGANGHGRAPGAPAAPAPAPAPASAARGARGAAAVGGGGAAAPVRGLWVRWCELRRIADDEDTAAAALAARADAAPASEPAAAPAAPTGDDGRPLCVSGTALNFAKMVHSYAHVMSTLQPIAADACSGICALFEMLVLALFTQFWGGARVGAAGWDEGPLGEHLAPRLKGTLLRLHHVLIEGQADAAEQQLLPAHALETSSAMRKAAQRLVATLHPPSQPAALGARLGPQECVCAADSLTFLAAVLESARPHFEQRLCTALGAAAQPQLALVASFFAQVVDAIPHLHDALLRALVRKTLDLSAATAAIAAVKWDLREIGTSESAYVHQLVGAAHTASTHISLLPLSALTAARLHAMIGDAVGAALVEGYAAARKCSQEGRAQMSIDVSTAQAELTSVLRCSVSLAHADEYVKAFYKPPGELVEWGIEHSAYSAKQLLSLVNLMPLKKKERDDVIKAFDDARGGELTRSGSVGGALESMMNLSSGAAASHPAGAEGPGNETPVKGTHVRTNSHGTAPRTFGSLGKWAHSEAAAKLKAANAAMSASSARRPASSGADGPDGSSGPASTLSGRPAAQ